MVHKEKEIKTPVIHLLISAKCNRKAKEIGSKDVEKLEPSYNLVGDNIGW